MTFSDVVLLIFITLSVLLIIAIFTQHLSTCTTNAQTENMNSNFVGSKISRKHIESMSSESDQAKPCMWVYWELINGAKEPPAYIQLCEEIMRKNGSRYFNVVFLNEKTIFDYIPDLRKDINDLPIALKTDYIRIKLLYLYGGIWVDADTILMNNLKELHDKLNSGFDFIGFGCTGNTCMDQEGFDKPSNGVMGSVKNGLLIKKCLNNLDLKLNSYYAIPKASRKEFNYFDLGKKIIWTEYSNLINSDPTYKTKMYHVPSYSDGTRNDQGKWVALDLIFKKEIKYLHRDKLLVVMLANSAYCGKDPKYNWFCKLSRNEILNGEYFVSSLFRDALKYNPNN